MAEKLPRAGEMPASPPASSEPDDAGLDVLVPDVTTTIAGREVTFREYGVLEGMQVVGAAEAFIADLVERCRGGEFSYGRVRPVIGQHIDTVVALVARSTGQPEAWIRGITDRQQIESLLMTWFGVNAGFFVREVVAALQLELLERAAKDRTGSTSSSGSRKRGSATSTASAS